MFRYFGYIIVFLLINFLKDGHSINYPWQSYFKVKNPACNSDTCFSLVNYLRSTINYDIDPCDDFYEYVCGNWQSRHTVPPYYSEWSVDMLMAAKALDRLKDILKEGLFNGNTTGMKQASALYNACMNLPSMGLLEPKDLFDYIDDIGNFPLLAKKPDKVSIRKKSWFDIHNYYLSITGESTLFSIETRADRRDYMKPMLHIAQMRSPYGLFFLTKPLTERQMKLYSEFLVGVLRHVIPAVLIKVPIDLVEKRLIDVLIFRDELWKLISTHILASDNCSPMSMKTFDETYHSNVPFSWSKIIFSLYKNTNDPLSISKMNICIDKKQYFEKLLDLLNKSSPDLVVNHMHLYFIERHLLLTQYLKNLLLKVVIHNGRLINKIRYLGNRQYHCISSNEAKDAVGQIYVAKYFSEQTRSEGKLLVKEIKDMLKLIVTDVTWLDNPTRQTILRTIDSMRMAIGYPEYYDDKSLLADYTKPSHRVQPISNEVFYSVKENRLSISAAFFNTPLYHHMFPLTVVYATIGSYLAHEIYHAFSLPVISSKKLSQRWSDEMLAIYENKTTCFYKQYNNKPIKELKHIPNAPKTDGLKTFDENIADSMGLNLIYWTFRRETWRTKRCPILQDLVDTSCEQLFFISYALTFCTSMTTDKSMLLAQESEHSPERLRVNGAVSNLEEFSKAFKCPKNAPLNPKKRCNLWK